jgi:hypothetical protein
VATEIGAAAAVDKRSPGRIKASGSEVNSSDEGEQGREAGSGGRGGGAKRAV